IDPPFKDIYSNYTLAPYIVPTLVQVGALPVTALPAAPPLYIVPPPYPLEPAAPTLPPLPAPADPFDIAPLPAAVKVASVEFELMGPEEAPRVPNGLPPPPPYTPSEILDFT